MYKAMNWPASSSLRSADVHKQPVSLPCLTGWLVVQLAESSAQTAGIPDLLELE